MKDKNQYCSNCYFFMATGQNENGPIGYCRANPPTFQMGENNRPSIAKFPIVLGGMWCGAWDATDD